MGMLLKLTNLCEIMGGVGVAGISGTTDIQEPNASSKLSDSWDSVRLDLSRAPYVLYGVKYIDLLSLTPQASPQIAGARCACPPNI